VNVSQACNNIFLQAASRTFNSPTEQFSCHLSLTAYILCCNALIWCTLLGLSLHCSCQTHLTSISINDLAWNIIKEKHINDAVVGLSLSPFVIIKHSVPNINKEISDTDMINSMKWSTVVHTFTVYLCYVYSFHYTFVIYKYIYIYNKKLICFTNSCV
jgi:hypothetical protein